MNLDDIDKTEIEDPRDWSKPSLAVIAANRKLGIVLWYVGAHVEMQIDCIGSYDIEELGFDIDPPDGISVFEGVLKGGEYNAHVGDYADTYLKGTCRAPTEAEWQAIHRGECPWDEKAWRKP